MAYIGQQPSLGNYVKLDDISDQFDGITRSFATTVGGTSVSIATPYQLILSLNGVVQEPDVTFTITNNLQYITFDEAPNVGDTFFGLKFGEVLSIPTVADGAIGTNKIAAGAVTTIKIADGDVTTDKLEDLSVTTDKLNTNSVTTAKVTDLNITLAKLSSAVQTSLGKADTAVQPATLTSSLTAANGCSKVLLSTQTASNSPNIDFTSVITSTYDEYEITFQNLVPQTDDTYLMLRTSSNNGTSYDATVGDYSYANRTNSSGSTVVNVAALLNASEIYVARRIGNSTGENANGEITIKNPLNTTVYKLIKCTTDCIQYTGDYASFSGGGTRKSTSAVNAIRLLMNSGNIASGTFRMYGIKKA
jgi:hypothetical protein